MRKLLDIALTALLPLGAAVVLVLAGRGAFRGATTFPPIFVAAVTVAGLVFLVARRRRRTGWHLAAVAVAVALSLGAVVAHRTSLNRARRAAEAAGMAALAAGPAPAIPFTHAVNRPAETTSPLDLGGRWTVVNFWATWCDPCRKEMPALERFWRRHRAAGLTVLGVTRLWGEADEASVRREQAEIERFLAEAGVTYPAVVSDAATVGAYGVRSWPTSILVGPDSRVAAYGVGLDGAEEVLAWAERALRSP